MKSLTYRFHLNTSLQFLLLTKATFVTPSFDRAFNAVDKIKEAIKFGFYKAFQKSKHNTKCNADGPIHSNVSRNNISELKDTKTNAIIRNDDVTFLNPNKNNESLSISDGYIQDNTLT